MAKRDDIDRRRLLISAAALAAFGIEPGVEYAEAANVTTAAQALSSAPGIQGLNVCAATARRLLEIERRNEIRREAQLPLLSIPKELRRMKTQEVSKEFERFKAARSKTVWEDVLKRHRNAEGNPNSTPNSLEGMYYQSQVRKILWEQFYLAHSSVSQCSSRVAPCERSKPKNLISISPHDLSCAAKLDFIGEQTGPLSPFAPRYSVATNL
jgi:hypothetical protein